MKEYKKVTFLRSRLTLQGVQNHKMASPGILSFLSVIFDASGKIMYQATDFCEIKFHT